jgi:hypothetical protein
VVFFWLGPDFHFQILGFEYCEGVSEGVAKVRYKDDAKVFVEVFAKVFCE